MVDTLGHLLTLLLTPANEQERAQVAELMAKVQDVTGEHGEVAFVDQGYTGEQPLQDEAEHGIRLETDDWSLERLNAILASLRTRPVDLPVARSTNG